MTSDSATELKSRLTGLGLSEAVIDAVWPRWWSQEAEASRSARAELRFSVARRLGIDPRSLFGETDAPRFLWKEEARFKHLSGEGDLERAGITSFGHALASVLVNATSNPAADISGRSGADLRQSILASGRPYVDLGDLLSLCWSTGVPVVFLRVFPWPRKRMAAMTVRLGDRSAILLAKDSQYPAWIAFYVAHELGHIVLEHIASEEVIVDLEDESASEVPDDEESAADAFALELLTGDPRPVVLPAASSAPASGRGLAKIALDKAASLQIEPGTLALSFGYSTKDWRVANASLQAIYRTAKPAWLEVNGIAMTQLALEDCSQDTAEFIEAVLGKAGM